MMLQPVKWNGLGVKSSKPQRHWRIGSSTEKYRRKVCKTTQWIWLLFIIGYNKAKAQCMRLCAYVTIINKVA